MAASPSRAQVAALATLTLLAAALRLTHLGTERFWLDEAVTAALLRMDLVNMLQTLPVSESTPPLYYMLAWGWSQLAGTKEVALRSLSAVLGIATVPVIFWAAAAFVSRRAALIAAAIAAVAPALVWYSQEARAYALLVLLAALSLGFFGRELVGRRGRPVVGWAITSSLALATHYFAIFLVLPEAVWLLARRRSRRTLLAVLAVGAAAAALLPLALHQQAQPNLDWISSSSLLLRVRTIPELFVAAQEGPAAAVVLAGGLFAAALAVLALRADRADQRGAVVPGALLLVGLAVPLVLAVVGLDVVVARNFLALWPVLAILVAAGLAARSARWATIAVGVALFSLSAGLVVADALDGDFEREEKTAELTGQGLDASAQRLAVSVAFQPSAADRATRGLALCPAGYRLAVGEAEWLSGDARAAGVSGESLKGMQKTGWRAIGRPPGEGDDTLKVVAVCAMSR